jgi:hypothetical protein
MAILGRMVAVPMTISWLGREDLGLKDRLIRELPGILNRALAGLDRLTAHSPQVIVFAGRDFDPELVQIKITGRRGYWRLIPVEEPKPRPKSSK